MKFTELNLLEQLKKEEIDKIAIYNKNLSDTEIKNNVKVISNHYIPPLTSWPIEFNYPNLPKNPTEVQKYAIPYILSKQDLNVISETSSGKTLCYVLPYIYILKNEMEKLIVLVPTRELVKQVGNEFKKYSSENFKVVEVVGGENIEIQRIELSSNYNVIVSTPGRMAELIKLKCVGEIKYMVIDEIDRILSDNYKEDIELILDKLNSKVKNYFSATFFNYGNGTKIIMNDIAVNKKVSEIFYNVPEELKYKKLSSIIKNNSKKTLIFCNTIKNVENLHNKIKKSEIIHSKKNMKERKEAIKNFNIGSNILIATDIVGRGMDINEINLVINYDFPNSIDEYIHRCGRTGRKNEGLAVSFLSENDRSIFKKLRRLLESNDKEVPSFLKIEEDYILE